MHEMFSTSDNRFCLFFLSVFEPSLEDFIRSLLRIRPGLAALAIVMRSQVVEKMLQAQESCCSHIRNIFEWLEPNQ